MHSLKPEFIEIAQKVALSLKTEEQWAHIESDDMLQNGDYEGGFDATEMEFCFSIYEDDRELWFQVPLCIMLDIAAGRVASVEARLAE